MTEINRKPWWNRPLWGQKSFLQSVTGRIQELLNRLNKASVPDRARLLHNQQFNQAKELAQSAQTLESIKFGQKEFILFLRIRYSLMRGLEGFEGLKDCVQFLLTAVDTKDCFIRLEQIESRYRGTKQQELYEFINELLVQSTFLEQVPTATFCQQVQAKRDQLLPQLKTEQGAVALNSYVKELETLAKQELALKLLALFKRHNFTDFSTLQVISKLVKSLSKGEVHDRKMIGVLIKANYEVFERLGEIIGVPPEKRTSESYAKMLQYIILLDKHQAAYDQFAQLLEFLRKWETPYYSVLAIRQEYSPQAYKLPQDFIQDMPGLELYNKYQKWLNLDKEGN